jgi:hypothetical protein
MEYFTNEFLTGLISYLWILPAIATRNQTFPLKIYFRIFAIRNILVELLLYFGFYYQNTVYHISELMMMAIILNPNNKIVYLKHSYIWFYFVSVSFSFSAAAFNEQVAMYRLNESTWELYSYENNIEIESNGTFALFYNEALVYLPSKTELFQNYPNPFNPSTTIKVYLKTTSQVRISIYNSLGQRVRELVNGQLPAARHLFTWDGRNSNGEKVSSGIYFYQLSTNSFTKVKKMILIK